jgi:hypothetical protein
MRLKGKHRFAALMMLTGDGQSLTLVQTAHVATCSASGCDANAAEPQP